MNRAVKRGALMIGSAAVIAGVASAVWNRRDPLDLAGKVVLITGGSRGLGLALARAFAKYGASIAICARDRNELEVSKRDLANRGADVLTVVCDVSDEAQVGHMIAAVIARYGRLDVVVNNAGVIQVGPVEAMSIADFEKTMNVMFWGTVHTTLAALPHLRRRRKSRVINITSVGAKASIPHLVPYSCAKFAAAAFSEGMGAELQGTGVKVVTIAPGLMRTGSHVNAEFKGNEDAEAAWFSVSASLPGVSMAAERAAEQIVDATRFGYSERILSVPANVLARLHGVLPGMTIDLLGMAGRFLPKNRPQAGDTARALENPWLYALTTLGRHAARRLLQPGM